MDIRHIYTYMQNRPIMLFGTGSSAREFYQKYKDQYSITGCFDNNNMVHEFQGLPVTVPKRKPATKSEVPYIVVCSAWANEIERQLIELGYEPLLDFINMKNVAGIITLHQYSNKKLAFYFGTCHGESIMAATGMIPEYDENFVSFSMRWRDMDQIDHILMDLFVQQSDVIIYEKFFGNIIDKKYKNISVKCITFPYHCFWGYWPQIDVKQTMKFLQGTDYGKNFDPIRYERDRYIDLMLEQNLSEDEILSRITSDQFVDKEEIQGVMQKSLRHMQVAEKNTTIKCSGYISDHYRRERIFYDFVHGSSNLLRQCALQVCEQLELEIGGFADTDSEIHPHTELPIYPCAAKALQLEMIDESTRYAVWEGDQCTLYSFEEFEREYIRRKLK